MIVKGVSIATGGHAVVSRQSEIEDEGEHAETNHDRRKQEEIGIQVGHAGPWRWVLWV